MDLNARVDENCGRKDGRTDELTDGRTENRMPISHLAKAGATINDAFKVDYYTHVGNIYHHYTSAHNNYAVSSAGIDSAGLGTSYDF